MAAVSSVASSGLFTQSEGERQRRDKYNVHLPQKMINIKGSLNILLLPLPEVVLAGPTGHIDAERQCL